MLAQGKAKEEEFKKFFKKVFDAYVQQDMKEHWDFGVRFDVKMIKSVRRHQQKDENIHWVELKNVNGEQGWLYGEADFFAFELEDYWVIVSREELARIYRKKMRRKNMVKNPEAILPVPEGWEEGHYHFGEEHRPYVYFYIDKEQMSERDL
jgi:hypothetical protein